MRVLITGGAGFIGSHTADALLAAGCSVRVLDALTEPVHPDRRVPDYMDERVEFRSGDVRDEATLLAALRDIDAVLHLAAFQDYLPEFHRFFDVNVTPTARIYELIVRERLPIRKVVVASSQAALGEGLYEDARGRRLTPDMRPDAQLAQGVWEVQAPAGFESPLHSVPTDETVGNPQNPYGLSKIAEERIALHLGRRYEIPSVAMRYSIVQGPRQSFFNPYSGACRVFSMCFAAGLEPIVYEDGEQTRDFVNIHDVVDANLLVLEDPRADCEMFHVGGDLAITVAEFASEVGACFGIEGYEPVPCGKYRFGDTRHIFSDVSKLRGLGWSPKRSVRDSVSAYRDWLEAEAPSADLIETGLKRMEELGVVRSVVDEGTRGTNG